MTLKFYYVYLWIGGVVFRTVNNVWAYTEKEAIRSTLKRYSLSKRTKAIAKITDEYQGIPFDSFI